MLLADKLHSRLFGKPVKSPLICKMKRSRSRTENSPNAKRANLGPSISDASDADNKDTSDDLECSQMPDFGVPSEGEVGIIEKMELKNFMCHNALEINFGPHVNFLIGRNGSGKSAVLAALVLGLGGKAVTTSRGTSLKTFIKEGESNASIIIKLRNTGTDSYRHDDYGRSITVERRITSDGASQYRLKDCTGKLISAKRDDLINILDQFNIQIDNPISILNQDTSRSFLNSSDASDKYKLFLKATQLEQMSSDYQTIIELKHMIESTLSRKSESLPEMEEHVKELEDKYRDIVQLRELKDQVQGLKNELAWATVLEKKQERDDSKAILEREEARLPKHESKIAECSAKVNETEEKWKEVNKGVEGLVEQGQELADEQFAIRQQLKDKKAKLKREMDRKKKVEHDTSVLRREKKELIERVADIRKSAEEDHEAARLQREQDIALKKEELGMLQAQFETTKHHFEQIEKAIEGGKSQSRQLTVEAMEAKKALESSRRQLVELQGSQQNTMKLYGPATPEIIRSVNEYAKAGKFKKKPVGPMGAHIKLRDPKWALAVESCLKGLLYAYCCDNHNDEKLLHEIFTKHCRGGYPKVIVSRFQGKINDTSRNRPRCSIPSILDMLTFEDPDVANCLIDQCHIPNIILMENLVQAQDVMWKQAPANVNKAYTINGDEVIGGRSKKYYANKQPQARLLGAKVEEAIKLCEADITKRNKDVHILNEKKKMIDQEVHQHTREYQVNKRKCMTEKETITRLEMDIQELVSAEEEQLPDVAALEEDLMQCDSKIEEAEREVEALNKTIEGSNKAAQEEEDNLLNRRKSIEELLEKLEPLKEELIGLENEIEKQKGYKKYYTDKKAALEKTIEKARKGLESAEKELEVTTAQAREYCIEVTPLKSTKKLQSQIASIEKRIEEEEIRRGNVEEVSKNYHEAIERFRKITSNVRDLTRLRRFLDKVIARRAKRFSDFRCYIGKRASYYFHMMLSQRGYSGKMKMNHKEETLKIEVNVEQITGSLTKDTRSLSGGERSFSTICFIMALWEAMESPFRVLDEFDVFMDMLNRRISMNMLLKVAKEQSNRQFILLTPQDMSNVAAGRETKIFRLQDPERGQTTINFPRASQS